MTSTVATGEGRPGPASGRVSGLTVWIDQDLCTGDGLCAQQAPDVFELDIDGLAYVKDGEELLTDAGSRIDVPESSVADVMASAKGCPGVCIHVVRASDQVEVAGPDAEAPGAAAES